MTLMYDGAMKKTLSAGFTLVELLVVIFIIGVLSALLMTNFVGIRDRAQDAKIKADFDQLKKSLRLYYNDYQSYPDDDGSGNIAGCGAAGTSTCNGGTFSNGSDVVYMSELPVTFDYYSDGNEGFILVAEMNNTSDQDIADQQTKCDPDSRSYYTDGPIASNEYVVCED